MHKKRKGLTLNFKDFKKQVLRNQLVPEELLALWKKSQWKLKAI